MPVYDAVVVGGGHNGLTAAAYLAKAGLKVAVAERREVVGGGVVTAELTLPGFKHDVFSLVHGVILNNPVVSQDELGLLSKYGLKYIYPEAEFSAVFPGGESIVLYKDLEKTVKSIERVSKRDAESYRGFIEWVKGIFAMLGPIAFSPPPSMSALVSELEGSDEGREFLRVLLSSALDVLKEWFEDERIVAALARVASEIMIPPEENGTGANILFMLGRIQFRGCALPEGGSGMLASALARCVEAHGGTILTRSEVKGVRVRDGKATGVVLSDGRELEARRAVVTDVHVRQLPALVGEDNLGADFVEKVRKVKASKFKAFLIHLALNQAPEWRAGDEVQNGYLVSTIPSLETVLRSFDDLKYGIPPAGHPSPLVACPTHFDPTRAPPGKHIGYVYEFAPYDLKDGGAAKWDEIKEREADITLGTVREYTTNMEDGNIVAKHIHTPLDTERMNVSFISGDQMHIRAGLPQYLSMRPFPGWGSYRTPVERLYMCGPSTHPGGSVSCGARAAVQVILKDMGFDFDEVIRRE